MVLILRIFSLLYHIMRVVADLRILTHLIIPKYPAFFSLSNNSLKAATFSGY